MSNFEKYNKIFIEVLEVEKSELNTELTFRSIERWDSLGHITLISEIEDAFEIMFETEDILNFGSYENGISLLEKYGVEIKS